MLKYIDGDLFTTKADIIAHGVNCKGAFGSGVALQMAKRYPPAQFNYFKKFKEEGWKLGDVQFVKVGCCRYIANCATQHNFFPRDKVHANYDAIRDAMIKVREFAMANKLSIAIPKIGAGLAGGDWSTIKEILKEVFSDYDVTVYRL